jgi:hypothetical protein
MARFIYSPDPITYSEAEYQDGKPYRDAQRIKSDFEKKYPDYGVGKITYKTIDNNPSSIDNPIKNAPYGSAFMLNSKNPVYYLRFGYLLEYIKENIIPRVKISKESNHASNPPMFDIDTNSWDNYMYSLPNQISLDPTKCIVRNNNFNSGRGITKVFQKIQYFREADIDPKSNQYSALPLNIYLNFDFITECLKVDDRGDVNLYEFISSICTGLNKALGGINNLEPIIDETSNTLKIIDTTPIPGRSGEKPEENYLLQLHGYKKSKDGATSNFIRKLELKTAITPEYATMITVGATAGGYIKGTEATAFSKWNTGLVDRFKEDLTPGKETSVKKPNEEDEAEVNYVTEFLYNGYVSRYGFSSFSPGNFKLVDDLIQKNISVGTEYYKYLLSKNKSSSGGTIGFIPFKLNFTMDGLSGIKIYNKLEVNTEFLPKAYGNNMDLIVTGVNHRLSNNDWETDIEATIIPKSSNLENITISTKSIQNTVNNVKPSISTPFNGIKDDMFWVYFSWQQGDAGAAQHYNIASGKRKTYGIPILNISGNWPGSRKSSDGVTKNDVTSLYVINPQRLAKAYIEVWYQQYQSKYKTSLELLDSTTKGNRTGLLYSKIKTIFQKYEKPSEGITWQSLATFANIENSLNTDTVTSKTFQGTFQMNRDNDNFAPILKNAKIKTFVRKKENWTNYDLDILTKGIVPILIKKLKTFKSNTGYK